MSALTNPAAAPETERETVLHALPVQRRALPTSAFALIVLFILVAGMVGLVWISTLIQGRSAELADLQAQEAELGYQRAALSAQVQDLRSTQNLANRAWNLGMRPNPHPAFIEMPSGRIIGEANPVEGDELRGAVPGMPVSTEPVVTEG